MIFCGLVVSKFLPTVRSDHELRHCLLLMKGNQRILASSLQRKRILLILSKGQVLQVYLQQSMRLGIEQYMMSWMLYETVRKIEQSNGILPDSRRHRIEHVQFDSS